MTTPRKKIADPRLIALNDQAAKAQDDCERWYARLARAFCALEKSGKRLASVRRRIEHQITEERSQPC